MSRSCSRLMARRSHVARLALPCCPRRLHSRHLESSVQARRRCRPDLRLRLKFVRLPRLSAVDDLAAGLRRPALEPAGRRLPRAQRGDSPRLQPLPAARLSGRRPLGGLSDRARHRTAAVLDRRVHPAARDAERTGHFWAARRRRRDRAYHHAGRSLGVPPPAWPRWRALGHRDGILDCRLHDR